MERDHRAWNEAALAKLAEGAPELAVEYARRAHELSRRNPDYLNTLGIAHAEAGELALAQAAFKKALKVKPAWADALVNLGKVLEKLEDLPAAAQAYERALAIAPSFPKLAVTLARVYRQAGSAAKARSLLEKSAVEGQDLALALAECDFELDGEAAALERLRAAVRAHPDWSLARGALAHLLLATGNWREGWRLYRPAKVEHSPPDISSGKDMLLRGEQGIGDVLFFLRFAPALRARGVRIALACEKKLHSILAPGPVLEEIREDAGEGVRIGDLPLLLEAEDTPPAWPLEAREKAQLDSFGPAPYLGVTWRAGTDLGRRREIGQDPSPLMKAIAPGLLGAALRGWPGTALLLQRGARPGDAAEFSAAFRGRVYDLSALGDDLPRLLAVLAALDEYVGVSNANMHFLAGLGKTARVLVPYPGEWRWMRRPGRSPWFPAFELYRQPRDRDWAPALEKLRSDLLKGRRET
jgi:tetratricopeptide (TPR) repeat protein